jgi:hypothetical protein
MIKSKDEMPTKGIEIDLSGPKGNAFFLIGQAKRLARQLGKDVDAIQQEMMEGDYEYLLEVFEREFGDYVTLYR